MGKASATERSVLNIEGMDCPSCATKIERAVGTLHGVDDLKIDYIRRKVTFVSDAEVKSAVLKTVNNLGYEAGFEDISPTSPAKTSDNRRSAYRNEIIRVVLGAVLVAIGGVLIWLDLYRTVAIVSILAGIASAGQQMLGKGFRAILHFSLDMDFLMSAAVIGAAALGEWTEAGVIVILYSLSELLESVSVEKSRRAAQALADLTPKNAFVIRNGVTSQVLITEVRRGDIVLVKPGNSIPVDGVIVAGLSTVNQANITGESMPLERSPGDQALAGSLNGAGALQIRAERIAGETTLDRIVKLVEEAQSARTPLQTSIERFARYYTPSVVGIAAAIAILPPLLSMMPWNDSIYRALTVLMIACPCALVLATPVTLVSALSSAAKNGVLVKGGRFFEGISRIKVMALDKTGTLTEGTPTVDQIHLLDGLPHSELLRLAATVESHSEHPIAQAILQRAEDEGATPGSPFEFVGIPGRGASAVVEGRTVYVGSHALFEERGLCDGRIHEALEKVEIASRTAMLVGTDSGVLGLIGVSDRIRPEAERVLSELRAEGMERIVMLTGDNHRTAEAVGKSVGADEIRSELLPEQKIAAVRELRAKYGGVVMVGDGVNDAPALAAADVGIAIGGAGSDAALETADIVLMSGGIGKLGWLYKTSRKARQIISTNIVMALGIKALFLVLAAMGLATLWMALFADTGVALLVVFNGLRMLKA